MSALASLLIGSNNAAVSSLPAKAGNKADEGSFLSILSAGAPLGIEGDVKTSLIDSLYDEDKTPDPVAAPVQVPTQLFVDNKKGAEEIAPRAPAPKNENRDEAPTVSQPEKEVVASKQEARNSKAEEYSERAGDVVKPVVEKTEAKPAQEIVPSKATAKAAPKTETLSDLAEEIGKKIDQLTALLSSIGSLLSANIQGAGQITLTKVTVSVKAVGNDLASAGNALAEGLQLASNQLDQLIAFAGNALNSGNIGAQNLASGNLFNTLKTTAAVVSQSISFQSLSFNNVNWQQQCVECEHAVSQFTALSTNGQANFARDGFSEADLSTFSDLFSQLRQELGGLRKLLAQATQIETKPVIDNQAVAITAATPATLTESPVQSISTTSADNPTLTPAVAVVDAKQAAPVLNGVNANIVAVAVPEATNVSSNLSGNNSQSQGGDRGFTSAPTAVAGSQQGASQTTSTNFSKLLNQTARTPVHEQIAVHIKTLPKDGSSKIEIQLDPESLGKVQIKMSVDSEGKTSLVVTADNKQTLDLLQRDARGLQQALNDAGLKTDGGSLDFNLRGGNQQKEQQASSSYQKFQPEEEELAPLAVVSRSYVVNMHDGLNIEI